MQTWFKQGGQNPQLNRALKDLSSTLSEHNTTTSFYFIPSPCNPADFLSHTLSDKEMHAVQISVVEGELRFLPPHFRVDVSLLQCPKGSVRKSAKSFYASPDSTILGCKCVCQVMPWEGNPCLSPFCVYGPLAKVSGNI